MGFIISNDVEVTMYELVCMTASICGRRTGSPVMLRHITMVYNCCDDTPLCHGQAGVFVVADLRYLVRVARCL